MRKSYFAQFSRNLGFCVFRCFLKFLIIIWLLFTLIKYSSYERIHHIVQKIPIFVHYFWNYKHEFMRKIMENLWLILYSCVISCKNDFFFEWKRTFMQNWLCIDTELMRNFVQKSHFVQKHEIVGQWNLLFRGRTFRRPKTAVVSLKNCNTMICKGVRAPLYRSEESTTTSILIEKISLLFRIWGFASKLNCNV